MPKQKPDKYWNEKQLLRDLGSGLNDVIGRGSLAGLVGAPADIANLGENGLRGLLGLPQVTAWGGSEHIGKKLEQAGLVSATRRPKTELLASLVSPGAAAKTVLNAPKTARNMLKALDNLDAPSTMRNMSQRGAIDVWHGSPHKFDTFKAMDNIGGGEGAQAYGHGGYHAGNQEVAQGYKIAGDAKYSSPDVYANMLVKTYSDSPEKALKVLNRIMPPVGKSTPAGESRELVENAINSINSGSYKSADAGNLYRNQLRWPDPAREAADPLSDKHFLDWDKPLSEQSYIQRQLLNNDNDWASYSARLSPEARATAEDMVLGNKPTLGDDSEQLWDAMYKAHPDLDHNVIHDTYDNLNPKNDSMGWLNGILNGNKPAGSGVMADGGQALYNSFGGNVGASNRLNELGIPGIRYLDGGSRSAGQGSYNYVTFDDALVNILERNGQPAGNLAKMVAPQDEALRVAQANAAKPVSEGGLGLRLDNTPEERASAMGFDTEAYTGANITGEIDQMLQKTWLSSDTKYASDYSNVIPSSGVDADSRVYPTLLRTGNVKTNQYFGLYDDMNKALSKKKTDTFKIENVGGGDTSHYVVKDPKNIRSRFAAFDPARKDSSDLLAGLAPIGLGALIAQPKDKKKKKPKP